MTRPLVEVLATLPDGTSAPALELPELAKFLRDQIGTDAEAARNARHALRDAMFADGGDDHMATVITATFEDARVRDKRRAMIPHAKFSNCLKRIVGELSTVYAEPAVRSVGGTEDNRRRYADLVEAMDLDGQMDFVNQMLNLHRALFVAPRVSVDGDRQTMVLDIATPATVRVLTSPIDRTKIVGVAVRVDMPMVRVPWARRPEWQLWTDHEAMYLDRDMHPIAGTIEEHGLGMNRWIALSYRSTATPGFWPGSEGDDLVAARVTEWLSDILLIKETKSATKQPIVSGDASTMARNQAADSETPIEAPEGVTVTTIDMGTDPAQFIKTSDHVLERTGNNYGLSMATLTHQGVQSAEARELMLAPVRERRRKQIKIFRRFERELAKVMSAVAARYAPDLSFEVIDWAIDFGETQVLLSKKERLEIFATERAAGLTNTVEFIRRENPDVRSDAQALAILAENIAMETTRNLLMRPLQQISGSLGADTPSGTRPLDVDDNYPPREVAAA